MTRTVCMCVDPGGTTGVVVIGEDGGLLFAEEFAAGYGTFGGPKTAVAVHTAEAVVVDRLCGVVGEFGVSRVLIEDFVLFRLESGDRRGLAAVRISALLWARLVAMEVGEVEFLSVSASKRVGTDDRLRRVGLWIRGKPHCRDAARLWVLDGKKGGRE